MTLQGRPVRRAVHHGETVEYIADQLLVKLKTGFANDAKVRRALLESLPERSSLEQAYSQRGRAVFHLPEDCDPLEVAERLSLREEVEFAQPNFLHSGG
jgi:hypothetical protein